ncbi:MAG: hypothetical protein BM563_10610 [Bacteroidetes bacterium MedPE-SWsnd-G1]|nr:MAG: hypothetical protein BM563_10610 [Bacteroidetes bacterium MedPE-SWsnd-G1]
MKAVKLLLSVFALTFLVSCSSDNDSPPPVEYIRLYDLLAEYEVWYVDYSKSFGTGDVYYVAQAFTLSFLNGTMYANNNLVGIGETGNGLGIDVGTYTAVHGMTLTTNHNIDGRIDFEVRQLSTNQIEFYNYEEDVTYILEGFQTTTFNYDALFNDNLDLMVQEYDGWEKTYASPDGDINPFDDENYLTFFFDEGELTFLSSIDETGLDIGEVLWDYEGLYNIDVFSNILTLDYDGGDTEKFDLTVINDNVLEMFHISSGTTYQFTGRGFNLIEKRNLRKKESANSDKSVRNGSKKRTKVDSRTKLGEKHLK